ncbi:hypothetical protein [Butyrivibrio sp. M55]|uniref:hypothetical protein n=1 Tax=Butyrivibrio sp. M55 TaxID=1855323 RepID=UPI0008E70365|nr:hypothetical protein [Butyrivibrio sp. M55]SFU67576.1 hypothetical protein SAMN05216540_105255 [Butyrivibrio sp. M55]
MKFMVKCKNKIFKTIGYFLCFGVVIAMCVAIVLSSETPEDFWKILVLAILTLIAMGWYAFCKIGAVIVNSIEVNSDTLIIKKIFEPKRIINVSELKKYKVDLKEMNKGPMREYIHVYYDDTFVELYEDNVCNFEVLLDYLKSNGIREVY